MNAPPAYTSLPDTASARTSPFIPEPRADQLLPSHLAIRLAATPPAAACRPYLAPCLPITARHRQCIHIVVHPRCQGRPTAPVPFGNPVGRNARRRELTPRVQITARHGQRIHSVVHPRCQGRPTASV